MAPRITHCSLLSPCAEAVKFPDKESRDQRATSIFGADQRCDRKCGDVASSIPDWRHFVTFMDTWEERGRKVCFTNLLCAILVHQAADDGTDEQVDGDE